MKKLWFSFPSIFLERLKQIVPSKEYQSVLEALSVKRPTTLRVNTFKMNAVELENEFKKLGIHLIPIGWDKNAFIIDGELKMHLTDLDLYKKGYFYVQSLSSMIPALILDPKKDEKILDLCAAPGSKTTQIASLMENTGEIVANDNSRIRVFKLQANLKIQGVTNTKVETSAGQSLWEKYPEYFDKALVDVPCSMEGRFLASDPKTYQFWSTKKIKELSKTQRFLLRSAISSTKVGGTVIYSTCTLAPEENEGVIDWILQKEKDTIIAQDIHISELASLSGITKWNGKVYNNQTSKSIRILPSITMEGFFVAKLKKIKSNVHTYEKDI